MLFSVVSTIWIVFVIVLERVNLRHKGHFEVALRTHEFVRSAGLDFVRDTAEFAATTEVVRTNRAGLTPRNNPYSILAQNLKSIRH